jgi:hypothetical protein
MFGEEGLREEVKQQTDKRPYRLCKQFVLGRSVSHDFTAMCQRYAFIYSEVDHTVSYLYIPTVFLELKDLAYMYHTLCLHFLKGLYMTVILYVITP